jgi:hypothetical protein
MEGPNEGLNYRAASGATVLVGRVHGATKWTEKFVF